MKEVTAPRLQYGVLPYRFDDDGDMEILLMTSRRTRRWIIPKGWPVKGLSPAKSAAREAFEEAGILGRLGNSAVGRFSYQKVLEKRDLTVDCEVIVFPLHVEQQLAVWPEAGQRELRWMSPATASETVGDAGLRTLIEAAAFNGPSWTAVQGPNGALNSINDAASAMCAAILKLFRRSGLKS